MSADRSEEQITDELVEAMGGRDNDLRFFRAPGRVNLMGDHTDYNDGFVLPAAIDRECVLAARPHGTVRLRSTDYEGTVEVPADGSADPAAVGPTWGRLVAGVVAALADRGRPAAGIDAAVTSSVPPGSGLSSSAAFSVALAMALCDAADAQPAPIELARACRDAELAATGVPCGIMDPLASIEGVAGHALLVDCRALTVLPVPIPDDLALLAIHSGTSRRLEDTPYGERRRSCAALAARLGIRALRDATPDQAAAEPLARHVVTEDARAAGTAWALAADDRPALAEMFAASHASLRDDVGVSTTELDALVHALAEAGAIGARLTGAGFGGAVVALAAADAVGAVVAEATTRYRAATGIDAVSYVCRAVDGAGPLEPA
jgi:galactokinase